MSDKNNNPSIDKVTVTNLDIACRFAGIKISIEDLDKIIDLVELIEKKGDKTNLMDLCKLDSEWEKHKNKHRQSFA